MNAETDILLSTYNGERFIAAQIESILAQTNATWRLLIRDDSSKDGTKALCLAYAANHPGRIVVLEDSLGNVGAVNSFGELLARSSAPYAMFCDQDDVWLPDKVAVQLQAIKALESTHGVELPLAVFSDARVVDTEMRPLSDSLLRYINRDGDRGRALNRLCVESNCYGCTMILNRALARRVGRFPAGVISHDWWCALVAAALGTLEFLDRATLQHRRHRSNLSPTKKNSWGRYLRERPSLESHRKWINRVLEQCEVFTRTYPGEMNAGAQRLFSSLAQVRRSGWLRRRYVLLRYRVRTTGLGRNIGFFLAI